MKPRKAAALLKVVVVVRTALVINSMQLFDECLLVNGHEVGVDMKLLCAR